MNPLFQIPDDGQPHPRSEIHNNDTPSVRNTLLSLGAPSISEDDFTRLFKGRFGEVLLFMSVQMKGRKQVGQDRHLIQEIKSHSKYPGRAPKDADSYSQFRKSSLGFNKALKDASLLQMQLKEKLMELDQADSQIIRLKEVIQEKRRSALLLRVLDERERVRISRFQELIKMMDTLRTASLDKSSTAVMTKSITSFKTIISSSPKISHTQEAISNLHAYHVRLRCIKEAEHEPSSEIVSRLRLYLSKKMQADQIELTIERVCENARVKATKKIRYHDTVWSTPPCISREQLSVKAKEIASRKYELQRLSQDGIALGFLCENLITSLSIFLQTSSILQSSLRDSIPAAKGYIDVHRLLSISRSSNDLRKREKSTSFLEEVCTACAVRVVQESEPVLRAVEGMIQRANRRLSYLATIHALHVPPQSPQEETVVDDYRKKSRSVEERAQNLLMRKVGKAALGDSIIDDIDTLMKDAQMLVGS